MKDTQKSKARLIDELDEMRRKVAALETELTDLKMKEGREDMKSRRPERTNIRTHIEFIADFDVIEARGVNLSEGGISFELDEDLPFEMRFDINGYPHYHRANLVWVKRLPEGGYRFGLMFTRPEPFPTF